MYQPNQFRIGHSFPSRMSCLRSMNGKESLSICPTGNRSATQKGTSSGRFSMVCTQSESKAWSRKLRQPECPNKQTCKISNGDSFSSLRSSMSCSNMISFPVSTNMTNTNHISNTAKKGRGTSSIIFSQVGQARHKKDKQRKVVDEEGNLVFNSFANY